MSYFTLRSASDDAVEVPLVSSIICQSAWLQAALGIGEEEGVVPIISTQTLRCLVEYMKYHAAYLDEEREINLPISCTCDTSVAGLGYDVHVLLPPSDIAFLDKCISADESWHVESQESFLELLVAADYVGHNYLRKICMVYFSCRLMSATESDILNWFDKDKTWEMTEGEVVWDDYKDEGRLLRLSDEKRLSVLKEMKKAIEIEE